ncbi:MAG: DUF805 domain-containing protein [Gammaproteobacteria bacterium]
MNNPYKAPNAKLYHLEPKGVSYLLLSFEGRINRRDFWIGLAIVCIPSVSCGAIIALLPLGSYLPNLALLVFLYPLFAVTAKRYHDQDKSGWLGLIWLAPLVGWMFALIECGFSKGTPMRNKHGPPSFGPLVERGE